MTPKLTQEAAEAIRQLHAAGQYPDGRPVTVAGLARTYGVWPFAVRRVLRGDTWRPRAPAACPRCGTPIPAARPGGRPRTRCVKPGCGAPRGPVREGAPPRRAARAWVREAVAELRASRVRLRAELDELRAALARPPTEAHMRWHMSGDDK